MSPAPLCQAEATSPTLLTHCSPGSSLLRTAPDYLTQHWPVGLGPMFRNCPASDIYIGLQLLAGWEPRDWGSVFGMKIRVVVGLLDVREGPGILRYV